MSNQPYNTDPWWPNLGIIGATLIPPPEHMWDRKDLQRAVYHLLTCKCVADEYLGGDSDHLRDAYRLLEQMLVDNGHWPTDKPRRWAAI